MPTPPNRERPGSPTGQPKDPSNLPEASVDETGNEDPGAELTEHPSKPGEPKRERTIGNHPVDPNGLPSRIGLPVGVDRETAADPGRQTPGAPKTDNRS